MKMSTQESNLLWFGGMILCFGIFFIGLFLYMCKETIEDRVWRKQSKKWQVWVDTRGKTREQIALDVLFYLEQSYEGKHGLYKNGDILSVYVNDPYSGGDK